MKHRCIVRIRKYGTAPLFRCEAGEMNGGGRAAILFGGTDRAIHLWACLAGLLLCSAASLMPVPHNVTVDAVNNFYVLKWIWDDWKTNYTARFSVEYTYNHQEYYILACNRTTACHCNLTSQNLDYLGCYKLRVRAEGSGMNSAWSYEDFCPHIQASLGPPFDVKLESIESGLKVDIKEPLVANKKLFCKLFTYRILYWEMSASQQIRSVETAGASKYLYPLKAQTEYCLQVRTLCNNLEKESPLTSPKCEKTQGNSHPPRWHILLPLFVFLLLVILLASIYHKKIRNLFPVYIQPTSILGFPMTLAPPLQIPEENCTIPEVLEVLKEMLHSQPEVDTSSSGIIQWSDSSTKDSGISSWESNSSSGQNTRDTS